MQKFDIQLFADGVAADATGAEGGVTDSNSPLVTDNNTAEGAVTDRVSFDELIKGEYKDDYENALKEALGKRMKSSNKKYQQVQEQSDRYKSALDKVAFKYGINNPDDTDALLAAIDSDNSYYEQYATEHGVSVDQAKTLIEAEKITRENEMRKQNELHRQQFDEKMRDWVAQGEKLKEKYPGFDFKTESENEQFRRFLNVGINVEDAYTIIHRDELISGAMAYTYAQAQQDFANTQRANAGRPIENGISAQQAAQMTDSIANVSSAQRQKLIEAANRGEKVTNENFRDYL